MADFSIMGFESGERGTCRVRELEVFRFNKNHRIKAYLKKRVRDASVPRSPFPALELDLMLFGGKAHGDCAFAHIDHPGNAHRGLHQGDAVFFAGLGQFVVAGKFR
jgi:hypothetical protein